jgi:hypothetical protein
MRNKSNINWAALIVIALGGATLYFNSVAKLCRGWSMLNPACWLGSVATHSTMLIVGIVLILLGTVKLLDLNIFGFGARR